jgi:hypothetical protein
MQKPQAIHSTERFKVDNEQVNRPHRTSQLAKRGFRVRGSIDVVADLSQDADEIVNMGSGLINNQDFEPNWVVVQM